MLQKVLSSMFLISASVGLQILVFMYGWGLHPQSWWWIIGGGVFGLTALRALVNKVEKESK